YPFQIPLRTIYRIHRVPADDTIYIIVCFNQLHRAFNRFAIETNHHHLADVGFFCPRYNCFQIFFILVSIEMYMRIYQHCYHSSCYFTVLPFSMPSGTEMSVRLFPFSAVKIMPSETSPRSLTGSRFVTTSTFLPMISSGSYCIRIPDTI